MTGQGTESGHDPRRDTVLRLEGEVEGVTITHVLEPGRHLVGALPESDLVLATAGVSRRHAVVEVSGAGAVVEDLGSKNGTWVDGSRVERARLADGAVVHFGRTPFLVLEVERGEVELALAVDSGPEVAGNEHAGRSRDTRTETPSGSDEPLWWASLLDRVVRAVIGGEPGGLDRGLAALRSGLEARGVVLVEWSGRTEPVVVAAAGELPGLAALEAARATFIRAAEATSPRAPISAGRSREAPHLAWAVAAGPGDAPRGLVVLADLPVRAPAPSLLELVVRFLALVAPGVCTPGAGRDMAAAPELVLADGYVVGSSRVMAALHDQLRALLRGDIPVLITGETGVGKELVARTLHASSARRHGPFVAVNCAAIPSELLEAELFGIREGVATGVAARDGKLELARGGVLLLDEIADMSADLQAKLLRVLQEGEVHPVGAREPAPVDVRVVAATNADIHRRIDQGRFRSDLYYRIAGFPLTVPPLRERAGDIPALVHHFLILYATEIGKTVRGVTVNALRALTTAAWPGNVRELQHEVRRLVYICPEGAAIEAAMLSSAVLCPSPRTQDRLSDSDDLDLETHQAELERQLIGAALARTRGNQLRAAALLGISRNGLAAKMKRHGLRPG